MAVIAAFLLAAPASAQWLTDYDAALRQAKKEKKLLLLNFTGSDWCGWCIKLKKEVFDTDEFKKYAAQNLVLVEADFPESKPQPRALKKQNEALLDKYKVEGFPTLVVIAPEGKALGGLGYVDGGPAAFIEELRKFKP